MARGRKVKAGAAATETLPLGQPDIKAPEAVAVEPGREHHDLSPSAFPKWQACSHYEPSREPGEEAERGTRLHKAYAMAVARKGGAVDAGLDPEDRAAVEWAVAETLRLFGGAPESVERKLPYYDSEGLLYFGTADAVCGVGIADLKTGQVRDYAAQMAAYALALMDIKWAEPATTHLIFCDEREVVTREWTAEEAISVAMPIIAARKEALAGGGPGPRACEYCGWCGRRDACPPYASQLAPAAVAIASLEAFDFSAVLADPERLGQFLAACKLLRCDYEERAQARAREVIAAGGRVPGWTIQRRKGRESLAPGVLDDIIHRHGWRVLLECGTVSIPKLRKQPGISLEPGQVVEGEPTEALVEEKGGRP
ncbi:MAG: DUF2800 domain-containing protein [Verrucomicrobiae bacterium]|nr:DUF2800 domain-containing protein [Verrucomicrobiae bacterium]